MNKYVIAIRGQALANRRTNTAATACDQSSFHDAISVD
jgi:hypothetical protein